MRPRVVLHHAVSLDGRIDGFAPDLAAFYRLVETWEEDATLAGSDTILATPEGGAAEDDAPVAPRAEGALLAVVDGRGRVRSWGALRECGLWGGVLAIGCEATPRAHAAWLDRRGVARIEAGKDRVDLAAALDALAQRHGARVVRVESGGVLSARLLEAGLADELSLLVHPVAVGGHARSLWRAMPARDVPFRLVSSKALDGGLVWLRYALGLPG